MVYIESIRSQETCPLDRLVTTGVIITPVVAAWRHMGSCSGRDPTRSRPVTAALVAEPLVELGLLHAASLR